VGEGGGGTGEGGAAERGGDAGGHDVLLLSWLYVRYCMYVGE